MTSNLESNIHCLAVTDAVFDDCQSIVKACFNDAAFNHEMSLGAVNSINWARILAQVVYYVFATARVLDRTDRDVVSFCVPTGNFGNMLAGYYAKSLIGGGVVDRLIIASNQLSTQDITFVNHILVVLLQLLMLLMSLLDNEG